MKKLVLTAIAALMIGGLQAQDVRPGKGRERLSAEQMAQKETERITKEFKLDNNTAKKISDINLKYAKKQDELRKNRVQDREKMRQNMMDLSIQKDKEFESVLSPKDFSAYKKQREERRMKMMNRGEKGVNEDSNTNAPAKN
ncbi:MAG: hypothetical protein QM654_10675 [Dysgonamonadaceae bacterium]